MTKRSIIADHPSPEMYRSGLEIQAQCARCGSSCDYQSCTQCDDGYSDTDWAEDGCPVFYSQPDVCDVCRGRGGWHRCLSSPEYCEANPLPGREQVRRGAIEWFTDGD